jgi:hypothetical protein
MGPCIVSIFQYTCIANKMRSYTVYLHLETALHVSGGNFTHHQERIQLHLQHLVLVTPLLLSAAISWNRFECAVVGVRHPQHTHIGILLGAYPILHISRIRVNSKFLFLIQLCRIKCLIFLIPRKYTLNF